MIGLIERIDDFFMLIMLAEDNPPVKWGSYTISILFVIVDWVLSDLLDIFKVINKVPFDSWFNGILIEVPLEVDNKSVTALFAGEDLLDHL